MQSEANMSEKPVPTSLLITKRRFGPLFAVQFGGALNDNVLRNAMIAMVAFGILSEQVENRALLINATLGLFMLPFFLFSASAGSLADRCPERSIAVRYIKGAEIFTMTVAAVGLASNSALMLLFAVFCAGVQSAYFGPFKYALLPELLGPRELLGGNALVNASSYVAILLGIFWGTELGSSSYSGFEVTSVLMVIALAGFLAALYMPKMPNHAGTSWREAWSWNIARDIGATIRASMAVKGMVQLILVISWFWTSGAILLTQLPVIVSDIAGYGHRSYLFLLLVVCLGIAVGSLLSAVVLRGRVSTKFVPAGITIASLGCVYPFLAGVGEEATKTDGTLSAFIAVSSHWPMILALLAIAVAMGFYIVPLYATLQVVAPKDRRGGMVATNNIVNSLMIVVGVLFAGFVIGLTEPLSAAISRMFAGLGLIGLLVAAWAHLKVLEPLRKATD